MCSPSANVGAHCAKHILCSRPDVWVQSWKQPTKSARGERPPSSLRRPERPAGREGSLLHIQQTHTTQVCATSGSSCGAQYARRWRSGGATTRHGENVVWRGLHTKPTCTLYFIRIMQGDAGPPVPTLHTCCILLLNPRDLTCVAVSRRRGQESVL